MSTSGRRAVQETTLLVRHVLELGKTMLAVRRGRIAPSSFTRFPALRGISLAEGGVGGFQHVERFRQMLAAMAERKFAISMDEVVAVLLHCEQATAGRAGAPAAAEVRAVDEVGVGDG